MNRHLPLILTGLGVLLILSGFAYDLVFAGIPYQDPTPEMFARHAFHSRIASGFYTSGGNAFLVGVTAGVIRVIIRRLSSRQTT